MNPIKERGTASIPFFSIPQEAFESLPLGVVKVNRQGDVIYMNKKLCEIAGVNNWQGKNIRIIFDDDNYEKVLKHLEVRFTKKFAEEYSAEVIREDDKKRIPVVITAIPESDEQGQIMRSIAFVRSLFLDERIYAIHSHIENSRDVLTLLKRVAEEVDKVAPWDVFSVSLYSRDRTHFRSLFLWPKVKLPEWQVQWNEIDDLLATFLRRKEILTINDFSSWLDEPEQEKVRKIPGVKEFADHGFCSIWRRPIVREGNVVAAISLYSTKRHAFDSATAEMLKRLPLQEATEMGIHYEESSNLQFRFNLKKDLLSVPCDPKSIARVIINSVAKHFKWENVSLFQVDEDAGLFRLLGQSGVSPEFFLREDYEQRLDEGILGRVYHDPNNQRFKNIGDVTSEEYKNIFKQVFNKTIHSALCLPILVDNKVCFLLNVEDSRKNAFAPEEEEAVDTLLQDLAMLLNRFCLHHRIEAIRQATKDMIFLTDRRGIIKELNPPTWTLLGRTESEMKETLLSAYIKDQGLASSVLQAPEFESQEIVFLRNDGTELRVLLSCASLPSEVGKRVFIGSDLSFYRRDEEIGILRSMYNEIALQTKTPLSLLYSWLRRLEEEKRDAVSEIAKKALQQLHKIDLTFDRLMLFERYKSTIPYNAVQMNLGYLVREIKEEMPKSEAKRVVIECEEENLPMVKGDIFQLSFCIESILSYLFRFVAADEEVQIAVKRNDGRVAVSIRGRGTLSIPEDLREYEKVRWISRTKSEMALGEDMIRSFIEINHGTYHETKSEGGELIFRFELPALGGG